MRRQFSAKRFKWKKIRKTIVWTIANVLKKYLNNVKSKIHKSSLFCCALLWFCFNAIQFYTTYFFQLKISFSATSWTIGKCTSLSMTLRTFARPLVDPLQSHVVSPGTMPLGGRGGGTFLASKSSGLSTGSDISWIYSAKALRGDIRLQEIRKTVRHM